VEEDLLNASQTKGSSDTGEIQEDGSYVCPLKADHQLERQGRLSHLTKAENIAVPSLDQRVDEDLVGRPF